MTDYVVGAENLFAFVLAIMGLWLVVAVWRGKTLPSVILKGWRDSYEVGMEKPVVSWWRALVCCVSVFVANLYVMDFYIWELKALVSLGGPDAANVGEQYAFNVGAYIVTVNLVVTPYTVLVTLLDAIVGMVVLIVLWKIAKNGFLGAWRFVRCVTFLVLWVFTLVFSLCVRPFEGRILIYLQKRKLMQEAWIRDIVNQAITDAKTAGNICSGAHGSLVPLNRGALTEAKVREIVTEVVRGIVTGELDNALDARLDDRVRGVIHTELDEYDRKVGGFVVTAIAALVKHGSLNKSPDPTATMADGMPIFRHRLPPTPGGS